MDIFPIYIRDRGGDIETIRNMWCVMLVPEIIFMTLLGTSVRRLGARGLLAVGIGAGAFRWLFLSQVTALPLLYRSRSSMPDGHWALSGGAALSRSHHPTPNCAQPAKPCLA